jgi:hypothetical protein
VSNNRRRRLDSTVAALQQKHGARAIHKGAASSFPAYFSTGFSVLDALTGCHGIPRGALTLLGGRSTSGKLTIAYKCLASAQAQRGAVALLDLSHTANPDYLQRCGVDLDRLLVARPTHLSEAVTLLLDLVQSAQTRLILLDGLPVLLADRAATRQLATALPRLRQLARAASCAVLLLDEAAPPWQRWLGLDAAAAVRQHAALHVELRRERWLYDSGELIGYNAAASLIASRWRADRPTTSLSIVFNGTVRAGATW